LHTTNISNIRHADLEFYILGALNFKATGQIKKRASRPNSGEECLNVEKCPGAPRPKPKKGRQWPLANSSLKT